MNGWTLLITVAFILYLGLEYYFWRKRHHKDDGEE
jgi:hypothetical protein